MVLLARPLVLGLSPNRPLPASVLPTAGAVPARLPYPVAVSPTSSPPTMARRIVFSSDRYEPSGSTEDPSLPPWKRVASLVPDDAPYKDAETLEEVEAYLADTVLVPIDEDRENPVFGVGDPHADLVRRRGPTERRRGAARDRPLDTDHNPQIWQPLNSTR